MFWTIEIQNIEKKMFEKFSVYGVLKGDPYIKKKIS